MDVKRVGTGDIEHVTLTRMTNEAIADRRALFEILTTAKNQQNKQNDKSSAALIDKAIILWTKMMDVDAENNRRYDPILTRDFKLLLRVFVSRSVT